ncbi:MAG: hypothetical protein E2O95_02880 [Acidobacteria bacterium]|nr:MAG: hypothetical protein E2O95_02880 [Acidobacteriota bacterium]
MTAMLPWSMAAQAPRGFLPDWLLPWLAVVLIVVCVGVIAIVAYRIYKDGLTVAHIALILLCLVTAVLLGFGAETAREILRTQEFMRLVLGLSSPDARIEDLERAIQNSPSEHDQLLAFDAYSRQHPEAALTWLQSPSAQLLTARPSIDEIVNVRESRLTARVLSEQARGGEGPVVVDVAALGHLLDASRDNPEIRKFLSIGRFDVSSLDSQQFAELLRRHDAERRGDGIIVRHNR